MSAPRSVNIGVSIRLFLADGTPDGIWVVEKSNWTGLALMAPRSRYAELRSRDEMSGPGVYVLTGPSESGARSARIYVGETDVLRKRLDSHQSSKDFWTSVVVFTSKDSNLNKAHVRYLESRLLSIATEAKRAELENGTGSGLPVLSEADQADMESFLGDMLLIYPVLGVSAFERIDEAVHASTGDRLILKGKDAHGEGQETSDGFVVFKGSVARIETVPSVHAYVRDLRENLTVAGILVLDEEGLCFVEDYLFASPSTAAMVILGRTANGRIEWKTEAGVTLKVLQEESIADG